MNVIELNYNELDSVGMNWIITMIRFNWTELIWTQLPLMLLSSGH